MTSIQQWLCRCALLLLAGCAGPEGLDRVLERGELVVVTRNGPSTYYIEKGEPTGIEYDLSRLFAEELGVSLRIEVSHGMGELEQSLRRGQADMAAAGLVVTPRRREEFELSRPYDTIDGIVVYRAGNFRPRATEDLANGSLVVLANSSHAENLRELREEQDALSWEEIPNAAPPDLLDLVSSGAASFALLSSTEFEANRNFFPRLRKAFTLVEDRQLAWMFPRREGENRLRERADAFLARIATNGTLAQLREHHFGHTWGVTQVNSHTFSRRVRERLPRYEEVIRQVAKEYQLDWRLLAAIAYQESHWDPYARSPTGVRGMMMLTNRTAREMGVKNRLDPLQSLRGGARYLKKTRRLLPQDILEPDRTWFALAAYNIGRGHLEDARVITERQGGDPHLWSDVREHLPLLQKSKYYRNTRYGYARGLEAVNYVKNIRHYYSILAWDDINRNRPVRPLVAEEYVPPLLKTSRLSAL